MSDDFNEPPAAPAEWGLEERLSADEADAFAAFMAAAHEQVNVGGALVVLPDEKPLLPPAQAARRKRREMEAEGWSPL